MITGKPFCAAIACHLFSADNTDVVNTLQFFRRCVRISDGRDINEKCFWCQKRSEQCIHISYGSSRHNHIIQCFLEGSETPIISHIKKQIFGGKPYLILKYMGRIAKRGKVWIFIIIVIKVKYKMTLRKPIISSVYKRYTALSSHGFSFWRSTKCNTYFIKILKTTANRMAYYSYHKLVSIVIKWELTSKPKTN